MSRIVLLHELQALNERLVEIVECVDAGDTGSLRPDLTALSEDFDRVVVALEDGRL
jgi:hypothetical protein